MIKRNLIYPVTLGILALPAFAYAQSAKHNYVPSNGYVPDAKTATAIAVAVWTPIYGEKHIQGERPFKAKLEKGIWVVEGTLPKGQVGGIAVAEISKQDGRILRVSHGK